MHIFHLVPLLVLIKTCTSVTDDWRHSVIPKGWNSSNPLYPPNYTRRPIGTSRPKATSRPTVRCFSSTGNIGSTATNSLLVPYYYRMILRNNNTNPTAVLPTLEVALTNQLIPSLFPDCTMTSRPSLRTLSNTSTPTVMGMSSSPQDVVLGVGVCNNTQSSCYILKGGLTLYTGGDPMNSNVALIMSSHVQQAIQVAMNNGTLNSAHASIEQIIYVDPSDPSLILPQGNTTIISSSSTTISSGLSVSLIILGTFLGIGIGVLGIRQMVRKRKRPMLNEPFPDFIASYDESSRKGFDGLEACVVEVQLNTRSSRSILGYQPFK